MRQIKEFEEFEQEGFTVTTDLGSAYFDYDEGVIRIQGSATKDGIKEDVEVILTPEDTAEFNVSVSASEGELTQSDLEFEAGLDSVVSVNEARTSPVLIS